MERVESADRLDLFASADSRVFCYEIAIEAPKLTGLCYLTPDECDGTQVLISWSMLAYGSLDFPARNSLK